MGAPLLIAVQDCRLKFPLAFASGIIMGPEFSGNNGYTFLFQTLEYPNLEDYILILVLFIDHCLVTAPL
jgi:hypothetical protein